MDNFSYSILAYYLFTPVANPQAEVAAHHAFFTSRDVTSRIYISEQGINGQMSASLADGEAYMEWLKAKPEFAAIQFKIQPHHEHVFPRTTVKYRQQLVALDQEVNLQQRGDYLSPAEWKAMLEADEAPLLLDVRNDYEWKLGHFEGAVSPPCTTFRDFLNFAEQLKSRTDPQNTPVMMYCTGGIRCELFSSVLKEKGFQKVYQLEGGVINYGKKQGDAHWLGKLFVFDDRLAVPLEEHSTAPVIGKCHHCDAPNETYHNCANMDCNELFLCCSNCVREWKGCCQEACVTAPRVRPYHQVSHKPFRKSHHYVQLKGVS